MIESGLYQFATTNAALQALMGQSPREKEEKIWSSFYFSYLPKADLVNTPIPGIVLDRLPAAPSEQMETLDPPSAEPPWTPITAVFQFGAVAIDDPKNPWSPSGYLCVANLSQTLYRQLLALATGNAPLPDGTLLQNVSYLLEYDAHYEIGDRAYLYRRILHLGITYVPS